MEIHCEKHNDPDCECFISNGPGSGDIEPFDVELFFILDQIKKAWYLGWLARVKIPNIEGDRLIVQISPQGIVTIDRSKKYSPFSCQNDCLDGMEIVEYIYGGELAGKKRVESGQKFRAKQITWNKEISGKIFTATGYEGRNHIMMQMEGDESHLEYQFDKTEVEPVFE